MEVKLEIDSSQLGDTVIDLFKSLTIEQKQSIGIDILKGWVDEPLDTEKNSFASQLMEDYLDGRRDLYYSNRARTRSNILEDNNYKRDLRTFQSTKSGVIDMLRTELLVYMKAEIARAVTEDENLKKIREELLKFVIADYPEMVYKAMVLTMSQNIQQMQHSIQDNLFKLPVYENKIKDLYNRLGITY